MHPTLKRWTTSLALTGLASCFLATSAFAAGNTYTVQPGDTFWLISQRQHISLSALESANASVAATNLLVGETLILPTAPTSSSQSNIATYTVQSGDTEWLIAKRLGISWAGLQAANPQVDATNLQPGQVLELPTASSTSASTSSASTSTSSASTSSASTSSASTSAPTSTSTDSAATSAPSTTSVTSANLYWMERVIAAEAAGQPMTAKLGVGAVVWNRMHSPYYGPTVADVVFQQINGIAQFTSVTNGWIYQVIPSAQDVQAAEAVLRGADELPTAYVFYNPAQTPSSSWVFTQPVVAAYGNLTFAS